MVYIATLKKDSVRRFSTIFFTLKIPYEQAKTVSWTFFAKIAKFKNPVST